MSKKVSQLNTVTYPISSDLIPISRTIGGVWESDAISFEKLTENINTEISELSTTVGYNSSEISELSTTVGYNSSEIDYLYDLCSGSVFPANSTVISGIAAETIIHWVDYRVMPTYFGVPLLSPDFTNSILDLYDITDALSGAIDDNYTDLINLSSDLHTNYVPYIGAISSVNLGSYNLSASLLKADHIQFNTTITPQTNVEGLLQWNATDGTLDLGMKGGDITQQIGQEIFIKAINKSGALIENGSPVYFNGRQGNRPKIYLARSDADSTSHIMGVTTEDIPDNSEGFITAFGYVRQIKTNYSGSGNWGTTWDEGDDLWVSKTIAGQLTNIEPTIPHHSDIVGKVGIRGGAGTGSIFIRVIQHKTLEELCDVNGTPLTTDGQLITWHNASGYFDFDKNINDYLTTASASGTYAKLDGTNQPFNGDITVPDIILTRSGVINRDTNNLITSIVKTGGRTITPTRDINGFISSITDGTKTWTFTRTSGFISSWTVT